MDTGRLLTFMLVFVLPFLILMSNVVLLVFRPEVYAALQQQTSVETPQAQQLTDDLIAYFLTPTYDIPTTSLLNAEEAAHILDVKIVIHLLLFLYALCFLFFLFVSHTAMSSLHQIRQILLYGSLLALATIIALAILPFAIVFDWFHHISFSPGTWIFPAESILIRAYPTRFFFAFFTKILLNSTITALLLIIGVSFSFSKFFKDKVFKNFEEQ